MALLPVHPSLIPHGFAFGDAAGPIDRPRPSVPLRPEYNEDIEGPPGYGPDPDYGPDDVDPEPTPPLPPEPRDGPQPDRG